MSVSQNVIHAVADVVGLEEHDVSLTSRLEDDLGADSIDMVEIVMELEDFFSVQISDADAGKCETVQDLVELVERLKVAA